MGSCEHRRAESTAHGRLKGPEDQAAGSQTTAGVGGALGGGPGPWHLVPCCPRPSSPEQATQGGWEASTKYDLKATEFSGSWWTGEGLATDHKLGKGRFGQVRTVTSITCTDFPRR